MLSQPMITGGAFIDAKVAERAEKLVVTNRKIPAQRHNLTSRLRLLECSVLDESFRPFKQRRSLALIV